MRLDWLKNIDNLADHLTDDFKIVYQILGKDKFIELFQAFHKTNLYFSSSVLDSARRHYIRSNSARPYKSLARELDCSEMYIHKVLQGHKAPPNLPDLF